MLHRPWNSDHKEDAPPRLHMMLLKLTKCDLEVQYVPGKKVISDCLNRAPLSETEQDNT